MSRAVVRYVATETTLSVFINVILALVMTTLLFHDKELQLWGSGGVVFDLMLSTALPVFAMTIGLTKLTRRRRTAGAAPEAGGKMWGAQRKLITRAILFVTAAILLLAVPAVWLLLMSWHVGFSFTRFLVVKMFYGALVGWVATPVIVLAALKEK